MTVAALCVATDGPYYGLPGVVPYDQSRDARTYRGSDPAVCHPPCGRWGRYWSGGPNPLAARQRLGDDEGLFAHCLWVVRTFGGVIEHPAHSYSWPWFGLPDPGLIGWGAPDRFGGRSCLVYQGNYGHRAAKATFLYAVARRFPELKWGEPPGALRLEDGFHSSEERARARAAGIAPIKRISAAERIHTPAPFRDLLLQISGHGSGA
jgi:hypothetical protein